MNLNMLREGLPEPADLVERPAKIPNAATSQPTHCINDFDEKAKAGSGIGS